jgi:SAM-dependent methyltransferase
MRSKPWRSARMSFASRRGVRCLGLDGLLAGVALAGWLKGGCTRDTPWVVHPEDAYHRRDLALVHHRWFRFHVQACAPEILALLEPIRSRDGIVLELGCGSGLLTRELTAAGHRVIATDASPAMLDLARSNAPAAGDSRTLVLPHDLLPPADAVVSVGHVLSYLPDEHAIDQALTAIAQVLRPGGLFAIDICDLAYGRAGRPGRPPPASTTTGRSSPGSRCPRPAGSSARSPRLCAARTAPGAATTRPTTTCRSTPPACPRCLPPKASR